MRLVIYEDYTEGKDTVYRFLTKELELPAITIAELHRERWQIKLFTSEIFHEKTILLSLLSP